MSRLAAVVCSLFLVAPLFAAEPRRCRKCRRLQVRNRPASPRHRGADRPVRRAQRRRLLRRRPDGHGRPADEEHRQASGCSRAAIPRRKSSSPTRCGPSWAWKSSATSSTVVHAPHVTVFTLDADGKADEARRPVRRSRPAGGRACRASTTTFPAASAWAWTAGSTSASATRASRR